ncbi:MAG: hypothetical protein JRI95_02850 [Deltaproteobacteria bacterium]|nr:hypothetical protein [Deltaproteobacteria bacterium]
MEPPIDEDLFGRSLGRRRIRRGLPPGRLVGLGLRPLGLGLRLRRQLRRSVLSRLLLAFSLLLSVRFKEFYSPVRIFERNFLKKFPRMHQIKLQVFGKTYISS